MQTITVNTPHQFKIYYRGTVFLHKLQRWLMKKSSGIWCCVKVCRHFRVTCCLHLDARQKEARFFFPPRCLHTYFYPAKQRPLPEDINYQRKTVLISRSVDSELHWWVCQNKQ